MSFFLTTQQMRDGSKDVTRRLGWADLKSGERVCAVEKGQGLKKGEKITRLFVIECVSNRPERLDEMLVHPYGKQECIREGFPTLDGAGFIGMFCEHNNCTESQIVNRIEFKRVDQP